MEQRAELSANREKVFELGASLLVHVEPAIDLDHDREDSLVLLVAGGYEGAGERPIDLHRPAHPLHRGARGGSEPGRGVECVGADADVGSMSVLIWLVRQWDRGEAVAVDQNARRIARQGVL